MSLTPTTERVVHLRRYHAGQREITRGATRFNTIVCGRRWGKTTMGIRLCVEPMLKGQRVGWFAGTNKLQADAWREIKRTLEPVIRDKSEVENRIEILTGGVLEMWSLQSTGAGRGRKYHRIVVDEAASTRDLETDWTENIRPTLTDLRGDAYFLGTPKGMDYFWALYQRGQDAQHSDWASWQMPTVSNPHIDPAEVESARLDMPERAFQQEYLAEFLSDGGAVFRKVRDAATVYAGDPEDGHAYAFGVDWGRVDDFTVIMVLDTTDNRIVAMDRFNQIDFNLQRDRLTTLAQRFKPYTIVAETNSFGLPNVEQLQRDGLPVQPFTTTNATKQSAIDALALAFEREQLRILNDGTLVGELLAYTVERTPSGMFRYTAPAGMHDDCVIALALAWQAAITGTVRYADSPWM